MALYDITGAVFLNGILVSGTWTPSTPTPTKTARESAKNRYTVYPVIKNDIEGTGTFVELTITERIEYVALSKHAAETLQAGVEAVAFREDENRSTAGGYQLVDKIVKGYTHETTIQTKVERMVDWYEGPPEEEPA